MASATQNGVTISQLIRITSWNRSDVESLQPLLGIQRTASTSVALTLGLLIWLGVSIAEIVIGALNFYKCPVEPYIPIYLVVGGAFATLKVLKDLFLTCNAQSEEEDTQSNSCLAAVGVLFNLFVFSWFIAGCFWVYHVYPPNFENHLSELYCDKTIYLFAFWLLNLAFIFLGLFFVGLCCLTLIGSIAMCCNSDNV